jgi:hypothetical protein
LLEPLRTVATRI